MGSDFGVEKLGSHQPVGSLAIFFIATFPTPKRKRERSPILKEIGRFPWKNSKWWPQDLVPMDFYIIINCPRVGTLMFVITKIHTNPGKTLGKWRFWNPNNGGLVQIIFLFLCIPWRWHRRIFFVGVRHWMALDPHHHPLIGRNFVCCCFPRYQAKTKEQNTAQNNSAFQYGESRDSRSKRFVKIVWDQLTCQAGNSYKTDFPIWIHTENNPLSHVRSPECKIAIFVVRTLFLKQSHQKMIKKHAPAIWGINPTIHSPNPYDYPS